MTKESKSIVAPPIADVPLEIVLASSLHVTLGFMRKILDWKLGLYKAVDDMTIKQGDGIVQKLRKTH